MPGPGRDVLGVILIEQRLGQLRERLATATLVGNPVPVEAIPQQEQDAITAVWAELNQPTPAALFGAGPEGPTGDGGKLGQAQVLDAHHALLAIPVVGDPRFAERT